MKNKKLFNYYLDNHFSKVEPIKCGECFTYNAENFYINHSADLPGSLLGKNHNYYCKDCLELEFNNCNVTQEEVKEEIEEDGRNLERYS